MSEITVKLNIDPGQGKAAVTCEPSDFSANRGNQQIVWRPGGNQGFSFYSLTGLTEEDPPFSNQTVGEDEITIDDDDTRAGDYPYTITVTADVDGKHYNTQSSGPVADQTVPCIKNT